MKIIRQICGDNNYKFRRDGVIFLKEYFQMNKDKILKSERFEFDYFPLLCELINDEDLFIQLDAIEAFCEFSEVLKPDQITKEFVPCALMNLDIEHGERNLELLQRSAELCGLITHKLSEHDEMHLTHKE